MIDSRVGARTSEVRPGRLVAALAGCGRHETPGTRVFQVRGHRDGTKSDSRDPHAREGGRGGPVSDEDAENVTPPGPLRPEIEGLKRAA